MKLDFLPFAALSARYPGHAKGQKEIDLMTSALNPRHKLRIDDLTNRAIMLADVAGRISLMKRDLAELHARPAGLSLILHLAMTGWPATSVATMG